MTFIDILYAIFIGPLHLVFEIIYVIANRFIGHPGLAIIILSLIMNFLVLPLYKRSDAMQEAARDIEEKLRDGVTHIKKSFTGDEQMMILQTYYRQNNYKPTDALNGSVSLLLEIPFFMAAYNFLSNLKLLQGVSLGPIVDLGAPDALLTIGSISINVLPVLMTLINIVSSAIYLKGFPLKTKIQLYGMALFFLVFLYTSPSGLVFYWTLNNTFSLGKTLFYKMKNPKKVLTILASLVGFLVLGINLFAYEASSPKREIFIIGLGVALQMPMLIPFAEKYFPKRKNKPCVQNDAKLFVLGALFLTVLVGLLIPSTLIAASPQEFVDITNFYNPLWYVARSSCLAVGTFLVWFSVFYWIANPVGKMIFDRLVWVLCVVMLVNYMFFGTDLGIISANLQYENGMDYGMKEQLINALILVVVSIGMLFIIYRWKSAVRGVLLTAVIALVGMSGINTVTIQGSISELEERMGKGDDDAPHFNLSTTGKNVVVIVLDRAMGQYIPYIFNEKPELQEQFDGFTYYKNTISYGGVTVMGAPAMYGGYEYTPIEINRRDTESMVSKHNEALKVMPVLFSENGYDVTVMDPPYANYQWLPDLSIYDEYSTIDAYITNGIYGDEETKKNLIQHNLRNFFCFSIVKTMPLVLQETLYEDGNYNRAPVMGETLYSTQVVLSNTTAKGIYGEFMDAYNVLNNLSAITNVTDAEENTFLMFTNDTAHEPAMLQMPEYVPVEDVDNTMYYSDITEQYTVDGVTLKMENSSQITHYHVNMAAIIKVGEWLDYLRENGVYDNTRIIITSDHGTPTNQLEELSLDEDADGIYDASFYFPVLLVKDFGSEIYSVSDEFMTNADVPTLTVAGLIDNPVNPFTGKTINNAGKDTSSHYIITSRVSDASQYTGNTFFPSMWWKVSDSIWDADNWELIWEACIIPEEAEE